MMVQEPTGPVDGDIEPEDDWFAAETSTFGDRLAGAREAAGMTQGQLARRLGVKVATLRKWEDDLSEPRANRLQMLSRLLDVSLRWLMTAEGEGLDGPPADPQIPDDIDTILREMHDLRVEMVRIGDRLGVLEKRLRRSLKENAE